jgi:hypothetical protein
MTMIRRLEILPTIHQASKFLLIIFFYATTSWAGPNIGGNNSEKIQDEMEAADVLKLSSDSMNLRQTQTRKYETNDQQKILQSAVGLLQDDGFTIQEIQSDLGIVLGSKNREAVETGQVAGAIIVAVIFGVSIPVDKEQLMNASIAVSEAPSDPNSTIVRVTFSRLVWNTANAISKAERLEEPEMYQQFFSRLSKSLFLTEQQL